MNARAAWLADGRVNIVVPEVYVASDNVLIMQRLDGITIADLLRQIERGAFNAKLRRYLERLDSQGRDAIYHAFAYMALDHGVMQADPHPGIHP